MSQNPLNIIRLLNLDTNPNGVDRRFNQNLFILIPGDMHWIQNNFRRRPAMRRGLDRGALGFDFGDVVPFNDLAGEVFET
jgi:hypothetical protein